MHCLLFNFNLRLAHNARGLGCYRIAHFVREHGWDAEVIEYAAYWDLERLQALARSRITNDTLWIGTSHIFSVWGDVMEEFCAWIKITYPWIRIISGSASRPAFDSHAIDYYIQGYGEHGLLALLKYLFSNGSAPRFDLLASGAKKVIPAVSAYPAYPMSSLMVKYQDRDFILPGEWLGVEFARGCKFECDFCNYPVLGVKGDHTRQAEDFREQVMDAYDRWGVTGYYVSDETFNDRTEKIIKFADVVESLPFDPWFSGYVRADLLISRARDREELARMGFRGHFYGIETFNQTAAKAIGKSMDPDRLQSGLLDIKSYFESVGSGLYIAHFGMIIGLPGETLDEIRASDQWFRDHYKKPHNWHWHVLTIVQSELDKPSKISLDHEKYGYQKMCSSEIDAKMNKHTVFSAMRSRSTAQDKNDRIMYWKNKDMDMIDAGSLDQELFDLEQHDPDRGIGCWNITAAVYHDLTIQQRLQLCHLDMPRFRARGTDIVEDYVTKKLSV